MWRRGTIAVLSVALVAGGCSGDDGGDGSRAAADAPATGQGEPVPSPGCEGGPAAAADLVEATLPVAGVERRWLLSAPARDEADDPLPLVLDFHGLGEGADVHAQMTGLGPLGVEEGFVTVFPHGTGAPIQWNVSVDAGANADLEFVGALLDRVAQERCIDVSRVYATGLSNGAMMTSAVACALSDRIAAIAPVAGLALPEGCEPSRPVPVLTFHGTADPILLFNGGVGTGALTAAMSGGGGDGTTTTFPPADLDGAGYPDTVRRWAALDGCDDSFADEPVSDTVTRRVYDCPSDAPVEFVIVEGGGHSWPSSEFSRSIERIVGPTTFDIDASREAWEFVRQFSLPAG